MKTSGIILELNRNQALIMTNEAGFMAIKRKPGMFIGQQMDIGQTGLKKPSLSRFSYSFGLALAAVFISIFSLINIYYGQNRLYAYVSVDINPSVEFAVNQEIRIISVKGLNNAGMLLLQGANFQNWPVDIALMTLVNKAEQNQYLHNKGSKYVLIAAALKTESLKKPTLLAKSIRKVEEKLLKKDIHIKFIQATVAQRKIALQNNLSTGRYILSNTAAKKGQSVNLNQAKADNISTLLEKAGFIKVPKVERGVTHNKAHDNPTVPKVKNETNNNNSIGSDSKTDNPKDDLVSRNNGSTSNDQKTEKDLNVSDLQTDGAKDGSVSQSNDLTDTDTDVSGSKDNKSDSKSTNSGNGSNKSNSNWNSSNSNSPNSHSGGSGSGGQSNSGKK